MKLNWSIFCVCIVSHQGISVSQNENISLLKQHYKNYIYYRGLLAKRILKNDNKNTEVICVEITHQKENYMYHLLIGQQIIITNTLNEIVEWIVI